MQEGRRITISPGTKTRVESGETFISLAVVYWFLGETTTR